MSPLLYHGTGEEAAKAALAQGLKPRTATKRNNWKHNRKASRKDCVYLTDIYAGYFAWNAAKEGELMAVVEVDSGNLNLSKLLPDEDFLQQVEWSQDPAPKRLGDTRRTRWFRDHLEDFANHWLDSFNALGTCCYRGEVPPEAISRVAYFPHTVPLAQAFLHPSINIFSHAIFREKYRLLTAWLFGKRVRAGDLLVAMQQERPTLMTVRRLQELLSDRLGCSVWRRRGSKFRQVDP